MMTIQRIFRGLLYLGVAASLTWPALQASPPKALPQTADKKMMHDKLQEAVNELNLTDDQKGKLKDVFSDAKSKREVIMSDTALTSDQKKDKVKALHQDTMTKVNDVLTPDQRTQLKEKLEAAKKPPASNY
jgi:Spy/CpxP family protein refolding chaperone